MYEAKVVSGTLRIGPERVEILREGWNAALNEVLARALGSLINTDSSIPVSGLEKVTYCYGLMHTLKAHMDFHYKGKRKTVVFGRIDSAKDAERNKRLINGAILELERLGVRVEELC